ncbi:MAG: hypothetical protein ACRENP_24720, partial [Longimicrobiales bacterium]
MRKIPLIIGWLVRLYPQDFRREYGADLVDTVAQRAADAGQRGDGLSRFWLREGLSLGRAALRARWDGWRAGRSRGSGLGLRGWTTLGDQLVQETRQSLRRLLRTPVFGIAAVLTLALAIGANAAIYTLVRRVVLDPFPYGEAAQLVMLEHSSPE